MSSVFPKQASPRSNPETVAVLIPSKLDNPKAQLMMLDLAFPGCWCKRNAFRAKCLIGGEISTGPALIRKLPEAQ